MNLKGKTAVITGAFGGLGVLLVKSLDELGVTCILVDKDKSLNSSGHPFVECDFSNVTEITSLVSKIKSMTANVDMLFNLAGIGVYKKIEEISLEDWNDSIAVNLTAPFLLCQGLLPLLQKSTNGLVLNFGSGMGVIPTAGRAAYCASKFGLRGMSLSLGKELSSSGIDVCLLTLGSVMTNFGPGGIEFRKDMESKGKKYLDPNDVISETIKICISDNRIPEYVIYPQGYDEV